MEIHDLANERIESTVFVCSGWFWLRRAKEKLKFQNIRISLKFIRNIPNKCNLDRSE